MKRDVDKYALLSVSDKTGLAGFAKALAEEFAALLGDEQTFIEIYKRATAEKFGFLYITMGSEPKFFSSYKNEFRLKDEASQSKENI